MRTLLEAYEQVQATRLFCVGYAWSDNTFGELTGSTVVDSIDGTVALRSFRSKNRHVTRAWLITGGDQ